MNEFWKAIDWIIDKMRMMGAVCLVGMTFLTCADVIGRLFRHPIFGSVEIVGFLATTAIAMALPYTDKVKGHVGVEILVRLLSERKQTLPHKASLEGNTRGNILSATPPLPPPEKYYR